MEIDSRQKRRRRFAKCRTLGQENTVSSAGNGQKHISQCRRCSQEESHYLWRFIAIFRGILRLLNWRSDLSFCKKIQNTSDVELAFSMFATAQTRTSGRIHLSQVVDVVYDTLKDRKVWFVVFRFVCSSKP
jgi:hypothetical protein